MCPAAFCQYASLPSLWCRHGAECHTSVSVSVSQRQQTAPTALLTLNWLQVFVGVCWMGLGWGLWMKWWMWFLSTIPSFMKPGWAGWSRSGNPVFTNMPHWHSSFARWGFGNGSVIWLILLTMAGCVFPGSAPLPQSLCAVHKWGWWACTRQQWAHTALPSTGLQHTPPAAPSTPPKHTNTGEKQAQLSCRGCRCGWNSSFSTPSIKVLRGDVGLNCFFVPARGDQIINTQVPCQSLHPFYWNK